MSNAKSVNPPPLESDDLAKHVFVLAIIGVIAYVGVVIALMASGGS